MASPSRSLALIFCFLGFVVAGCNAPPAFLVETVVHPDGSCDRMIWQPKDKFLPEQALKPEWNARWKTVSDASGRPGGDSSKGSDELKYFIARGSFTHPREIPPHYRYVDTQAPDAGASELERTYARTDYGFVVEHRWHEKITDIVTLPDFIKARDELIDLLLPLFTELIENVFGKDYDVSRFVTFLRSDFRRFLENVSFILYDAAVRQRSMVKDAKFDDALINHLYAEAERLGLDRKLLAEAFKGKFPGDKKDSERTYKVFLGRVVARYFRHRNRTAVSAAEAEELIRAIVDNHRYEDAIREQSERIGKRLQGDKQLETRINRSLVRITGLYSTLGFLFSGGPPEYEFTMVLPGELIESNATRTKAGRIHWKFGGGQLFPDGFGMDARSIFIDRDGQRKVLGRVVIDDETKAIEFMEIVGDEGPFLEAVRKLRQTGDRNALREVKTSSFDEALRARKLQDLLLKQ